MKIYTASQASTPNRLGRVAQPDLFATIPPDSLNPQILSRNDDGVARAYVESYCASAAYYPYAFGIGEDGVTPRDEQEALERFRYGGTTVGITNQAGTVLAAGSYQIMDRETRLLWLPVSAS